VVDTLLNWLLRGALALVAAGAAVALLRWIRAAAAERRERWAVRIGWAMIALALVYAGGHVWLLVHADEIEAGRMAYRRFGDPREAERNRAEVRGWILDCSGEPGRALARYERVGDVIDRVHPLGEAAANLVGGGAGAEERDYTVERLFAAELRRPRNFIEAGELHPVGTDVRLSLCAEPTATAWTALQRTGRPGAVVVQDVVSGAVVAYAATGGPGDAPLGIRQYAPPGSVFKLALAAAWWDAGMGDPVMACPASIQVTPRARISNAGGFSIERVEGPAGMLIPSCNTTAVAMAQQLRQRIGVDGVARAYRAYGFTPYGDTRPPATDRDFWNTSSTAWARRMGPTPSRIRMTEQTGPAEWAQIAIGQGPVDVTPIGVSRFVQAIGNGGVMVAPTLEWELARERAPGDTVMTAETARRLQGAMLATVERGTARAALPVLSGVGWHMGGKTGTAQVRGAADDGWFAGLMYDEERRPRYTVVVYLRGGGPGGRAPTLVAAEMTRHMAQRARAAAEEES
jgi:hypothetical protein